MPPEPTMRAKVENDHEMQPIIREVKATEELLREAIEIDNSR